MAATNQRGPASASPRPSPCASCDRGPAAPS
jgi:hypothetical protein